MKLPDPQKPAYRVKMADVAVCTITLTDNLLSTRFSFARRPYPYAEHGLPDHLMRGLPVPSAATLRTVPTAITLAFFTAFFLIDAGTTEGSVAKLFSYADYGIGLCCFLGDPDVQKPPFRPILHSALRSLVSVLRAEPA